MSFCTTTYKRRVITAFAFPCYATRVKSCTWTHHKDYCMCILDSRLLAILNTVFCLSWITNQRDSSDRQPRRRFKMLNWKCWIARKKADKGRRVVTVRDTPRTLGCWRSTRTKCWWSPWCVTAITLLRKCARIVPVGTLSSKEAVGLQLGMLRKQLRANSNKEVDEASGSLKWNQCGRACFLFKGLQGVTPLVA